jgi:hypothetical protein
MGESQALAVEICGHGRREFPWPGAGELESTQESSGLGRCCSDDRLALCRVEKYCGLAAFLHIVRKRFQLPGGRISEVAQVDRGRSSFRTISVRRQQLQL